MSGAAPLHPGRQRGFTLIEVMIAVVVLSIGLLGVAALQLTAKKSSHQAWQRAIRCHTNPERSAPFLFGRTFVTIGTMYLCQPDARVSVLGLFLQQVFEMNFRSLDVLRGQCVLGLIEQGVGAAGAAGRHERRREE